MKQFRNILWGMVLIIIGFIFGLNALDITDINIFFDGWWTLFIILPCFIGLFNDEEKTGNIIGLGIGIALLLCCQDILDFGLVWKLLIPVILVVIGLSFIFKDAFLGKAKEEMKKINAKRTTTVKEYCATFSGQTADFTNEEFEGSDLSSVFGSITCDLRNAKIKEEVVINASAIFGGIDIYVPENAIIKVTSNSIFGGVSKDKKREENIGKNAKTIYINVTCIFGGVEIK